SDSRPDLFSMFPFAACGTTGEVVRKAHRLAVSALKSGKGRFPVGMTVAMQEIVATPGGEEHAARATWESENIFLETARGDDFVGVQTYTRRRFGPDGP